MVGVRVLVLLISLFAVVIGVVVVVGVVVGVGGGVGVVGGGGRLILVIETFESEHSHISMSPFG